jgi:hypothetical protein
MKVIANSNGGESMWTNILFAATILAARKLHEVGDKPCPAREFAIADAIEKAEQILKKIDARWPTDKVAHTN